MNQNSLTQIHAQKKFIHLNVNGETGEQEGVRLPDVPQEASSPPIVQRHLMVTLDSASFATLPILQALFVDQVPDGDLNAIVGLAIQHMAQLLREQKNERKQMKRRLQANSKTT